MSDEKELHDTKLEYLKDTYLFEGNANILGHGKDSAKGVYIVLDETIFYPQGGGQPSDTGTIQVDDLIFNVHFVSFNNGKVYHFIKEEVNNEILDKKCLIKIDQNRRMNNAKSHTSGHILASVVESLASEITGIKGYHFPEGPYVEFQGKLSSMTSEELTKKACEIINEKIKNKTKVTAKEVDPEELKNQNRNFEVQLQPDKKARVVEIEGFPAVPCGGTHLKSLSDLNEVNIRKIQFPKGNTRIAYAFT